MFDCNLQESHKNKSGKQEKLAIIRILRSGDSIKHRAGR